jgi:hypothetical protein
MKMVQLNISYLKGHSQEKVCQIILLKRNQGTPTLIKIAHRTLFL